MPKTTFQILLTFFMLAIFYALPAQVHILLPADTSSHSIQMDTKIYNIKKWRFAFSSGMGYRINSSKEAKQMIIDQGFAASDVDKYFRQVKWGYKISSQIHRMISENYGLGIDYQFHHSSGTLSGYLDPGDNVSLFYSEVSDDIYTNYVGLSIYSKDWIIPETLKVYSQFSLGLTLFRQESAERYYSTLITGNTLGSNLELGLDYYLNPTLAIGIKSNFFASTLRKVTVNDGSSTQEVELPEDQKEGLSRIDLSVGVQIYF